VELKTATFEPPTVLSLFTCDITSYPPVNLTVLDLRQYSMGLRNSKHPRYEASEGQCR
jgi:hypothetical protein